MDDLYTGKLHREYHHGPDVSVLYTPVVHAHACRRGEGGGGGGRERGTNRVRRGRGQHMCANLLACVAVVACNYEHCAIACKCEIAHDAATSQLFASPISPPRRVSSRQHRSLVVAEKIALLLQTAPSRSYNQPSLDTPS